MDDKKGIKVGATTAGIGGLAIGAGKFIEDNYKGKGLTKVKKINTKVFREGVKKVAEKTGTTPKNIIKGDKVLGSTAVAIGGTLAGVSAYKHYKNKKKNKKDDTNKG